MKSFKSNSLRSVVFAISINDYDRTIGGKKINLFVRKFFHNHFSVSGKDRLSGKCSVSSIDHSTFTDTIQTRLTEGNFSPRSYIHLCANRVLQPTPE